MSVLFPFVVVRFLFCYAFVTLFCYLHLLPRFVICICYPILLYAFVTPFCCLLYAFVTNLFWEGVEGGARGLVQSGLYSVLSIYSVWLIWLVCILDITFV